MVKQNISSGNFLVLSNNVHRHWSCLKSHSDHREGFRNQILLFSLIRKSLNSRLEIVEFFILIVKRAGFQIYTNISLNEIRNFYKNDRNF